MDERERLLQLLAERCGEHSPVVLHRTTSSRSPGETIQITYDPQITLGRPLEKQIGAEEIVRALVVIHLVDILGYSPEQLVIEYKVLVHVGHDESKKYADIAVLNPDDSVRCLIELKAPSRLYKEWEEAWRGQLWGLSAFINPTPNHLAYGSIKMTDGSIEIFVADTELYNNYPSWQQDGQLWVSDLPPNDPQPSTEARIVEESHTSTRREAAFWERDQERLRDEEDGVSSDAANEVLMPVGNWVMIDRQWRIKITFSHEESARGFDRGDVLDVRVRYRNRPTTIERVRLTSQVLRKGSGLIAWGIRIRNPAD